MAASSQRTQTIVQLNDALLAELSAVMSSTGENRSALIRRALREWLDAAMARSEHQRLVASYARSPAVEDPDLDLLAAAVAVRLDEEDGGW